MAAAADDGAVAEKKYLPVAVVADEMALSAERVRTLAAEGVLGRRVQGGRRRAKYEITREDIDRYLAAVRGVSGGSAPASASLQAADGLAQQLLEERLGRALAEKRIDELEREAARLRGAIHALTHDERDPWRAQRS